MNVEEERKNYRYDEWLDLIHKDFPCTKDVYFEVNDGWMSLIYSTMGEIDQIVKNNTGCKFYLTEVKEKYGKLRIYWILDWTKAANPTDAADQIQKIIDAAEDKSASICMFCGKKIDRRTMERYRGGFRVCQDCLKKKEDFFYYN